MTIFSNSANRLLALSILTFLFLASPARSQETVDLFDPADPVIGYNLVSYQDNNPRELEEYFKAIDELIAVNADHVNLVVFRRVGADGAFDYTSGPSIMTIYLAALRAKTNNLKVTITPIFETETENAWRGAWNPTGEALSNFNRDYLRFVRWLAVISRWSDADKLNVGSELSAFVNNPDNKFAMQRLLAVCSRIYSGELGYNANWDNVESPAVKEIFWDDRRINTLSVSMYPYMRLASFREADRSNRDPVAFAQQVKSRWEEIIMGELLPRHAGCNWRIRCRSI